MGDNLSDVSNHACMHVVQTSKDGRKITAASDGSIFERLSDPHNFTGIHKHTPEEVMFRSHCII